MALGGPPVALSPSRTATELLREAVEEYAMETGGADMSRRRNAPDPRALAIAQEIQERLHPAEVILLGSRAAGDHRPDSDVDLMAVVPDETAAREADETLRRLLAGKYEAPVVNVLTMTREEFRRTAPLAQSRAGQAARHGVTPKGRSLDYRPERQPEAEEILQASIFWLVLAETHLDTFILFSEDEILAGSDLHAYQAQQALERAFKGLLTAGNDDARFRRDAALMWWYMEGARPVTDRPGAREMEELLSGTAEPDGQGCRLTAFSEAFRRGDLMPELSGPEQEAVGRHLAPAVNMLIAEALTRSGGIREDIRQERHQRTSRMP